MKSKKNLSDNFEILNKLQKKKDLIIFDIGANTGRWIDNSIQRFNIENIHAFEPSKNEFKLLKEKYSNDKKIILNNFAMGDRSENRIFNINYKGSLSSFYEVNENTNWFKKTT